MSSFSAEVTEQLDHQLCIDPLLNCLMFLTKHYGKPFSVATLSAGLPLKDGKIRLKDIPRAASRGGLSAKLVKQSITDVSTQLLPCICLLEDGRACVVLEINDNVATISWSELDDSIDKISIDELQSLSTGYLIYVKKRHRFDARSPSTISTKQGHWFWDTIRQSKSIYRDALVAAFFINLFAIASPLFVMNVYDRVVPNLAMDTLWVLALGMFIIVGFDFAFKQVRAYLFDLAAKKSDVMLSATLFEKVLNLKMSARPQSVGGFARNVQDFDSVKEFIASATIAALVDLPFAIIFIAIIYFVAGPVVIVPIAGAIIMCLSAYWVMRKMASKLDEVSRIMVQKNALLIESLVGIESLKIAGAESQFQNRWEELVGSSATINMAIKHHAVTVSNITSMIQQLSAVLVVVMGVYFIAEGEISLGGLIAAVMLSGRVLSPFMQISMLSTRYNQAKSALTALDSVMELPEENTEQLLHRPYVDGRVDFDNVSFAYPDTNFNVVSDVSISIKANEKVAIIGRIGSGKTTLEKMLLQFYSPTQGAIRIDGVDINQISPADLRQKVGCVPQDINLFYGTIRENITLGVPHVEDDRILRAAELAGVTEFTDHEPDGLDKQVGERGLFLSGGQRQKVALARALLFNPPILVLDEPTSNLDNLSEHQVKKNIASIANDKTLILITHKMSMLQLVDRVVVIDKGKVVADDKRDVVLAALGGGATRGNTNDN